MPPPPPPHTHTPNTRTFYCRFGQLWVAKWPHPDLKFSQFPSDFCIPSGGQIISQNYRFLLQFFILLPYQILFYQNSLSFVQGFFPMEYSTSLKEANTKVIVTKMVTIIKHLAARAKSGSVWNCNIHFATDQ